MLRKATTEERFFNKVDVKDDNSCWEWKVGLNNSGYGSLCVDGSIMMAHRFSWEHFNKRKIPFGYEILHLCDNKKCVNPHHLKIGTRKDNMQDAKRKGRIAFGERNGMNKFTKAQVLEARERYKTGCTLKEAGSFCGMSEVHVWQIVNGARWANL